MRRARSVVLMLLLVVGLCSCKKDATTAPEQPETPDPMMHLTVRLADTGSGLWTVTVEDSTYTFNPFGGLRVVGFTYDSRESLHVSIKVASHDTTPVCSPVFSWTYPPQYGIPRPPEVSFDREQHVPSEIVLSYYVTCYAGPVCQYSVAARGDGYYWPPYTNGSEDWGTPDTWEPCE
jgi:hypothetical protein